MKYYSTSENKEISYLQQKEKHGRHCAKHRKTNTTSPPLFVKSKRTNS